MLTCLMDIQSFRSEVKCINIFYWLNKVKFKRPKLTAMKKAFFPAISFVFICSSCEKNPKLLISGCQYDTLTVAVAHKMIQHYGDTSIRNSYHNSIRYFRINSDCLASLIEVPGETTFWPAADTITNRFSVIIESKEPGNPPKWFLMKKVICPPPYAPPCDSSGAGTDFVL